MPPRRGRQPGRGRGPALDPGPPNGHHVGGGREGVKVADPGERGPTLKPKGSWHGSALMVLLGLVIVALMALFVIWKLRRLIN